MGFRNIVVQDGKATIVLNQMIYPKAIILNAVNEFSAVADISFSDKVEITPKDKSKAGLVAHEFCNYLIGLVKNGQGKL